VRPAATVTCPVCTGTWPARTSRFCGRCGETLSPATQPAAPPRRRRALLAGGFVLAALLSTALTAAGLQLSSTATNRPEPEVDLPTAAELPVQPGLTGEEARAALAPFDPDRLRCEPVGCERWRLEAPGGADYVAHLGELLVFQADQQLVAIDAQTGERSWTAPLHAPDGEGPAPRGLNDTRMLAANDEFLVVARETGELRVIDLDGRHRWRAPPPPPAWIWSVEVVADVVLTVGPPPSAEGGNVALHAYAVRDGSPRWSAVVRDLQGTRDDGLLVLTEDRTLAQLDPSGGEVLATYEGATWADHLAEGFLALGGSDPDEPSWVADTEGRRLLEFEGHVEAALLEGETLFLFVRRHDRPSVGELVALGVDGEERWRRELSMGYRSSCCPAFALTDDGALYLHDPRGAGRLVDAATGSDRPHRDPPPIPTGDWWTGHVSVKHGPSGELILADQHGRAQVPSGQAWLLHDDPVVLATRDGLLGVDLVPPPVGPRPATRLPAS
jgi:outer membrane protein assembly factor BamB